MSKPTQCEFEFAPGVRCQMVAGHDEPYYPYHDYGQWGEYGTILSEGSRHEVHSARPGRPPQEEWTGNERKGTVSSYPPFRPGDPLSTHPPTHFATVEDAAGFLRAMSGSSAEASDREGMRAAFRQAQRETHPDHGGDAGVFSDVMLAGEKLRTEGIL